MRAIDVSKLNPGDTVQGHNDTFRVIGFPQEVLWQEKRTVRVSVVDDFGRTRVLVREDIVRCLRRASS